MYSSRKKPWRPVKTPSGIRYKYDYQDLTWGIARTRATFKTLEEVQVYHESIIRNAQRRAVGEAPERYFGHAMAEYVTRVSVHKASYQTDIDEIASLRWPFYYNNTWHWLEDLPLHGNEGGIIWGAKLYFEDLRRVLKRSYMNKSLYHLRTDGIKHAWYQQPTVTDDIKPAPRIEVTDRNLINKLETCKGRGPFSNGTLIKRKNLISGMLSKSYRDWRWIDNDLSELLGSVGKAQGRIAFLSIEELNNLLDNVDEHFAYLIKGAAWIGWRRSNLIGLTWDRVVWPQTTYKPDGSTVKIPGYLYVPEADQTSDNRKLESRRIRTKNKKRLETIMTDKIESLLRELWTRRHKDSEIVFHNGEGDYWGDFRRRWTTAKRRAGIPADFRWHDLRHTWATNMINQGTDKHIIMTEQGWNDIAMVDRYAHISHEARYAALQGGKK